MKYQPPKPSCSSRSGLHTLRSDDGAVTFTLARTATGVFVERIQERGSNARIVQLTVFRDDESFRRWCEADSVRFDYPLVYMHLRRDGDALFNCHG